MSFGTAARSSRGALPACPCGGGAFRVCCGPALSGTPPETAEGLMRSRFTAFAIGDERYVRETWHPRTTPASIDLDDALQWQRLEILGVDEGGPTDTRGTVEFRAHWRHADAGERGTMHEVSRFQRIRGRWYYVGGDVHGEGTSP